MAKVCPGSAIIGPETSALGWLLLNLIASPLEGAGALSAIIPLRLLPPVTPLAERLTVATQGSSAAADCAPHTRTQPILIHTPTDTNGSDATWRPSPANTRWQSLGEGCHARKVRCGPSKSSRRYVVPAGPRRTTSPRHRLADFLRKRTVSSACDPPRTPDGRTRRPALVIPHVQLDHLRHEGVHREAFSCESKIGRAHV